MHLLKTYSGESHVNVGSGSDITILELAQLVCDVVGCESRIETDPTKPDGTPRKLMDVSRLFASGWRPRYDLPLGLRHTYAWFCEHFEKGDARGALARAAEC